MCEIITPIVERSVTIACMTTYELVTKDYANDPDESRLRAAAHLMVSSLAGSLALVTCKEPLRVSLGSQLKMMLQPSMDPGTLAQAVELLVNDNLDLGCTIIERAATDKAVRDIDKSLAQAYEARVAARQRNVDFYQRSLMQQQQQGAAFPAALPESLKPKPGNPAQQRVYEDYGRLPRGVHPLPRGYPEGGAPPSSPLQAGMEGAAGAVPDKPDTRLPEGTLHGAALIEGLMTWTAAADSAANAALQRDPNASFEACGSELAPVLGQFKEMLGGEDVTLFCAKRIIRRSWEYLSKVHAGLHAEALALCVSAMGGPDSLGARASAASSPASGDVAEALIRKGLLLLPEVDAYLAKLLLQTRTQALGDFAVLLARAVKDGLAGYAMCSNEAILQLLSAARQSSRARAALRAGLPDLAGLKDKQDPPGFHQQVAQLFEDFARRAMANPEEKLHAPFVAQLRQAGLLNLDDVTDRMLRILVELAVNHCLQAGAFNGRPYLRLLLGLASELGPLEEAAAAAASAAQAGAAPRAWLGYAYLEMLSHRCFMPRLLMAPGGAGWPLFEALLIGLLQFLEPALRAAELAEPLRLLYKGTLRLLLVLLHDFPEFLCEHQYRLCEVIPPPAIQMRNLILSAFPRNMRLPDPFTPNLKVDLLPEIAAAPRGVPPADKLLPRPVVALVDSLLQQAGAVGGNAGGGARTPRQQLSAAALQQLVGMLQAGGAAGSDAAQQQGQQRYSTPLLAGLVLYVAAAAQPHGPVLPGSPAMQLLGRLVSVLDPEGRYLLLNAVANQLRYPNSHTHYFSCVLLALFSEAPRDAGGEEVRAQITRVLLERLIVNRPHPWGLLITFIELIKNPRYCFWQHGFTRCAPEIERLFESVARSCMGVQGGAAAAGKLMEGAEDGIKA
ncbi:CCR4-Not complex component, Not1-domain-containing protein [Scenedesmus sp. NREL 46B-D3]|nr:CCR4-Not complex component, Not1-domain-containing protein [Scenedesmus sp. NREL 46B-D3]